MLKLKFGLLLAVSSILWLYLSLIIDGKRNLKSNVAVNQTIIIPITIYWLS